MRKSILAVAILSYTLFAAESIKTDKGVKMPYMAFPMKEGKGMYTTKGSCNMCHSFGYVINQGKQSREFWHKKVLKMITVFHAPIHSQESIEIITNYLYENYGNGSEK